MSRKSSFLLFAIVLAAASDAAPVRAGDSDACASSFEDAQRFRTAQRLRAAREALGNCARPVCPKFIVDRCKRWKDAVESALPSIALHVVDDHGNALRDATVNIDDQATVVPDDGVVSLDPGAHRARAERAGSSPAEERFQLDSGDKNHAITLRLAPAAPTAAPSASSSAEAPHAIPAISYVLGGVGIVGVGLFTYLGLSGRHRESELESTCSPRCSPDDVSSLRSRYITADIFLGVGVVSLGVATWLALRNETPNASTTSFDVGPRGVSLSGSW